MNLKRMISITIVMIMLIGTAVSAKNSAVVASGSCGGSSSWVLYEDGEFVVSGTGDIDSLEYTNHASWHNYRNDIKTLTIQDGITNIGDWTFAYCYNLTAINFPNGLKNIGSHAFAGCSAINTTIDLSGGITNIGDYAFENCHNFRKLVLGSSLQSVGAYAFGYCDYLSSVYYTGDSASWAKINISDSNGYLTNSKIYYNYVPGSFDITITTNMVTNDSLEKILSFVFGVGMYGVHDDKGTFIVAVYDEAGKLVGCEYKALDVNVIQNPYIEVAYTGTPHIYKVFFWDNLNNLTPYCKNAEGLINTTN